MSHEGIRGDLTAYRLPSGRHGLAPKLVAENQHWRLLGAAAEVLAEFGYTGVSSQTVAARAGVSKSAFYRHFDNVGDCLLAAHAMVVECVWELVSDACAGGEEWSERVRAGLDASLGFLAAEPPLAHMLGAEAAAGDAAIAASRERLIECLATLLRADPRLVAAAFALVSDRVVGGEAERLPELASELAELLGDTI